jgi:hypothetical protein
VAKTRRTKGVEKLKDPQRQLVAGPGAPRIKPLTRLKGPLRPIRASDDQNMPKSGEWGKAGVSDDLDKGVIELDVRASIEKYVEAAKQKRVWDREARLSGGDV